MFDFAWSEIALIAAVALIAIGPKDMPVAIRSVTSMIKKARRMAGEFQTHVDEMLREANLDEVRNQINDIRNFDVRGELERHVDPDGSLRGTLDTNPLLPTPAVSAAEPESEAAVAVGETGTATLERPPEVDLLPAPRVDAPAFIPPNAMPPEPAPAPQRAVEADAPAFIPPEVVLERQARRGTPNA
jgi:sec-independent protein translocase protein TatB